MTSTNTCRILLLAQYSNGYEVAGLDGRIGYQAMAISTLIMILHYLDRGSYSDGEPKRKKEKKEIVRTVERSGVE